MRGKHQLQHVRIPSLCLKDPLPLVPSRGAFGRLQPLARMPHDAVGCDSFGKSNCVNKKKDLNLLKKARNLWNLFDLTDGEFVTSQVCVVFVRCL